MTITQILAYIATALLLAWGALPYVKPMAAKLMARFRSGVQGGATDNSGTIAVEQAQAATLLLMRFNAQTPRPKEYPLIEAEIAALVRSAQPTAQAPGPGVP